MKTAIILSEGIKQVMFTPENDNEKQSLKMIAPSDDISLAIKTGSFHTDYMNAGYSVNMCKGGYLRAWDNDDSIMLVLTPKEAEESKPDISLDKIEEIVKLGKMPIGELRKLNSERAYQGIELTKPQLIYQIAFLKDAPEM